MTYFLLVYDRKAGRIIDRHEYAEKDRAKALQERFRLEATHRDHQDIEIVVLGAESEDALRKTHGRYFSERPQDLVS